MMAVKRKGGEAADLEGKVGEYARRVYAGLGGALQDALEDVKAVAKAREQVVHPLGSLELQGEALQRYYRMLCTMESRFPISREKTHINKLAFSWTNSFKENQGVRQHNLNFEKAAVAFNYGALLSQRGLDVDRTTDDGVKVACKFFQEAAGVFAFVKDHISIKVDSPKPVDLSLEASKMLEHIMLAQAQECFHEKALRDGKSAAILAKLAKHAGDLYAEAYRTAASSLISDSLKKTTFATHAEAKAALLNGMAEYHLATVHQAKEEVGEEIARLKRAEGALAPLAKKAKGMAVAAHLERVQGGIARRLQKAVKENESIYLVRVPAYGSLAEVKGAALVKCAPPAGFAPTSDPEVASMFAGLVPDSSAKALSRYTEMVDVLISEEKGKLSAAADQVTLKLRELDLPDLLRALESSASTNPIPVPEPLKSRLEDLEANGGYKHLEGTLQQLYEARQVTKDLLAGVENELRAEDKEDQEMREAFRERWTAPPSETLSTVLREKILGYKDNIAAAEQNDQALAQQLRDKAPIFSSLTVAAAAARMPRIKVPMLSVDGDAMAVAGALEALVERAHQLKARCAKADAGLSAMKRDDNILPKLMSTPDNYEALFKEEALKYGDLMDEVEGCVAEAAAVGRDLGAQHAAFVQGYGVPEWRRACAANANVFQANFDAYLQFCGDIEGGMKFYANIQDAANRLSQQCGDFCYTRRLQRRELYDQLTQEAQQAEQRAADEQYARELHQQMAAMQVQQQSPPPPVQVPDPQAQYYPAPQYPPAAAAPGQAPPPGYAYAQPAPGAPPVQYPQPQSPQYAPQPQAGQAPPQYAPQPGHYAQPPPPGQQHYYAPQPGAHHQPPPPQ